MCIDVHNKRNEAQSEETAFILRAGAYLIASHTSRWVWQKRIPTFDEFMNTEKKNEGMTDLAMFAKVKSLNAAFGGAVIGKEGGETIVG